MWDESVGRPAGMHAHPRCAERKCRRSHSEQYPYGYDARSLSMSRSQPTKGNRMCSPARCGRCGKTTWSGCGMHVDTVMSKVTPAQRCTCAPLERPEVGRASWRERVEISVVALTLKATRR